MKTPFLDHHERLMYRNGKTTTRIDAYLLSVACKDFFNQVKQTRLGKFLIYISNKIQ